MAFDWIQSGLGALGLFGASKANAEAERYNRAAATSLGIRNDAQRRALAIADTYDPAKESQAAVDQANAVAGDRLGKALSSLNMRFLNAGGQPGGDTRFKVQAQGAYNRVSDPLRQFIADSLANRTQKKLSALQAAVGMGGDLTGDYLKLADSMETPIGPSLGLLSGGLSSLLQEKTPVAASQGTTSMLSGIVDNSFLKQRRQLGGGISDRLRSTYGE